MILNNIYENFVHGVIWIDLFCLNLFSKFSNIFKTERKQLLNFTQIMFSLGDFFLLKIFRPSDCGIGGKIPVSR